MNRGLASVLLLFLFFSSIFSTSPSDFFSDTDIAKVTHLVTSSRTEGTYNNNLEDTLYATWLAVRLGIPVDKPEQICTYASSVLSQKSSSVQAIFQALFTQSHLKCLTVDAGVITRLEDTLENGNITDIFFAARALEDLRANGQAVDSLDEGEVSTVVEAIINLVEDDGSVKTSEDEDTTSALNAGLAFHALGSLPLNEDQKQRIVEEVASKVGSLFSLAEENEVVVFADAQGVGTVQATSLVWTGVNSLAKAIGAESIDVSEENVVGVAEFLIRHKHVSTLKDAFFLLRGLDAVADSEFFVPLVLTLPQRSFLSSSKRSESLVKVKVTDVFGHQSSPARVYLVRAFPVANQQNIILRNQEALVDATDPSIYSFNFLATKPEPGHYSLEFSVTPLTKDPNQKFLPISDVRNIKVVAPVEIVDLELRTSDAKHGEDDHFENRYSIPQSGAFTQVIDVNLLQTISIFFKVRNQISGKPVRVHQAFVKFIHETGVESIFAAKAAERRYEFSLNVQQHLRDFNARSGRYAIHVIAGDSIIQHPVSWKVADVRFNFGNLTKNFRSVETRSASRPEIVHQFRPSEKLPYSTTSLGFTALCLAPMLILFFGFLQVGINLGTFPTGSSFLFAVGFHVCIAAIFGLYAFYWFFLNVVQTIGLLVLLGIPTVFFGVYALRHVRSSRLRVGRTE